MNSDLNEYIDVPIPKAACLVLFELLTSSYEKWRNLKPDDSSASPMNITAEDHAQRVAVWKLEGALERTLPEVFSSNYDELLTESKCILSAPIG